MHTLFHIHIIHHRLLETSKRKPVFTPRKRASTRQWCDVQHSDRHGAHDFYHAPDVTFRSNARYRKRTHRAHRVTRSDLTLATVRMILIVPRT